MGRGLGGLMSDQRADRGESTTVIRNVRIFDGASTELVEGHVILSAGRIDRILPLSEPWEPPEGARVIDCATEDGRVARVLTPGLIDAHCHVSAAGITMVEGMLGPDGLMHCKALSEARRILMRGFTTVRDMGGGTGAVKQVIDAGEFPGPRIYPSNAAVSQTGGHGDFSTVHDASPSLGGSRSRAESLGIMRVADGPAEVLAAVREQLKKGASQVKLMAGGGVTSSHDELDVLQFTPEELGAAVLAAQDWGTYVAVHVYTAAGVRRALDAGVRSIEHGHLADEATVARIAEKGAWLSTQPFAVGDHSFPDPASAAKDRQVCAQVGQVFEWARRHGVRTAFGTDLLFTPDAGDRQILMLTRLSEYMAPAAALTMATADNAELLRMAGPRDPYGDAPFGVVRPGARADLLVADGDPTQDLSVLADPHRNLLVIIKDGQVHKNTVAC